MKIKIGKKNIELKYTIRAMIMYENMAQKSFNPQTLTDIITFMYCIIVSSSKDYSFKFDQFIDYLDEPHYQLGPPIPEPTSGYTNSLNTLLLFIIVIIFLYCK